MTYNFKTNLQFILLKWILLRWIFTFLCLKHASLNRIKTAFLALFEILFLISYVFFYLFCFVCLFVGFFFALTFDLNVFLIAYGQLFEWSYAFKKNIVQKFQVLWKINLETPNTETFRSNNCAMPATFLNMNVLNTYLTILKRVVKFKVFIILVHLSHACNILQLTFLRRLVSYYNNYSLSSSKLGKFI